MKSIDSRSQTISDGSAARSEQGIEETHVITTARYFPELGSFISVGVKAPNNGGHELAPGAAEVPRSAEDVPGAGGDLVVLGVFGRCAPVLTSIVTTISAFEPRASREPVHAGSPTSKERTIASMESCLGPRTRSGCATVEWWCALSSDDRGEENVDRHSD